MSAQTLEHVRERLHTAERETRKDTAFTIVSYKFSEYLTWTEAMLVVQDAASRGWLPMEMEWVVGQNTVTKLRLVKPAQASLEAQGSLVSPAPGRNSASTPRDSSKSDIASEVREVHAKVQTTSRTSSEQKELSLTSERALVKEIAFVLDCYRRLKPSTKQAVTFKAEANVAKCLTLWSKEKLCAAIEVALVQNPKASCSSIFQSYAGVARLLGEPVPKFARKDTWLTPYVEIFHERIPDGEFQYGEWSRTLRRLEQKHGAAEVAAQFRGYMSETDPSYVSAKRFGIGFGRWRGGAKGSLASKDTPFTVTVL